MKRLAVARGDVAVVIRDPGPAACKWREVSATATAQLLHGTISTASTMPTIAERIGTMSPCCEDLPHAVALGQHDHAIAYARLRAIDRDEARADVFALWRRAAGPRAASYPSNAGCLTCAAHIGPTTRQCPSRTRDVDAIDDADDRGIDRDEPRIEREGGFTRNRPRYTRSPSPACTVSTAAWRSPKRLSGCSSTGWTSRIFCPSRPEALALGDDCALDDAQVHSRELYMRDVVRCRHDAASDPKEPDTLVGPDGEEPTPGPGPRSSRTPTTRPRCSRATCSARSSAAVASARS